MKNKDNEKKPFFKPYSEYTKKDIILDNVCYFFTGTSLGSFLMALILTLMGKIKL